MRSNTFSEAIISKGSGDTDGNPTVDIKFAGCYGNLYGTDLTDREILMFKKGVLAEQERIWDRLPSILNEDTLKLIKSEELFNE